MLQLISKLQKLTKLKDSRSFRRIPKILGTEPPHPITQDADATSALKLQKNNELNGELEYWKN
nr:MAG TPA: hypothetical protein [Caudoviricetes sp.]